jgi:hypothetical protein
LALTNFFPQLTLSTTFILFWPSIRVFILDLLTHVWKDDFAPVGPTTLLPPPALALSWAATGWRPVLRPLWRRRHRCWERARPRWHLRGALAILEVRRGRHRPRAVGGRGGDVV